MGETDLHREVMFSAIESLKMHYAGQRVYVSGNILLFYRPGDRRRHISPDVLVVKDLEHRPRENYLLWKEGRPPNVVIEVTSRTTRREDLKKKFELYRDEIHVAEYFLFDPLGDYLDPRLQGFRLREGQYEPIESVDGRLPSLELGLIFERHGDQLRIFDPVQGRWLPTHREGFVKGQATIREMKVTLRRIEAERLRSDAERQQTEMERRQAESERQQAVVERQQAATERQQAEIERRQAERERQRADADYRHAEAERTAAEDARRRAEAEATRLRVALTALRKRLGGASLDG